MLTLKEEQARVRGQISKALSQHPSSRPHLAGANHLKGLRERKRKLGLKTFDYDFDFFDEEGILSYIEYLRDVKNMKNTTIEKSLEFLRWFLRWSLHKGFHQNNCFETFRPKFKKTQKKVVFLTKAELEKLE